MLRSDNAKIAGACCSSYYSQFLSVVKYYTIKNALRKKNT